MMNKPEKRPCLYVITADECDSGKLLDQVEQALRGGADIVQYRNKRATAALRSRQAAAVQALCQSHDVPLIINDHIELALEVDAAGLHLGGDDGDLASARLQLGPQRWLGASCYQSLELAQKARGAGADYVAFGAMFASGSKPMAARASLQLLEHARSLDCAVCAIGGINSSNAYQVLQAGADWIAVIGSIFQSADPGLATRALAGIVRQGVGA